MGLDYPSALRGNPTSFERNGVLPATGSRLELRDPGAWRGTRRAKRHEPSSRWLQPLLRVATPADLEALYRIEIVCFKERRFRKDHVEWILGNERAKTFAAQGEDGQMQGAVMLLFEGPSCRVLSVATMPEFRRRGLGTEMMRTAEAEARKQNCTRVRLEVSTQNYSAIEFYRGLGYKTDGVLYGYYSWGEDAYSMVRTLTDTGADATRSEPPT